MTSATPVDIEVFGLRLSDGELAARVVRRPLAASPDIAAADAIGLDPDNSPWTVLHSTSWRWDEGRVVLTYLCCPDPNADSLDPTVTPNAEHADTSQPTAPGAHAPSDGEVLHHGIDHYAWLADHHPRLVQHSRTAHAPLWDQIMSAGRHRAGQLRIVASGQ